MEVEQSIGDLMKVLYKEYLEQCGDPDKASVMTAAAINNIIKERLPGANLSISFLDSYDA